MSKLYGYLDGDSGKSVTKSAQRIIDALVQTQDGGVLVSLQADGSYEVWLTAEDPGSRRTRAKTMIASGNLRACAR